MSARPSRGVRAIWPALVIVAAACIFCWPVFLGRIMAPADMCLLMLPWQALQDQFPGFERPHNPMFDPIQQYLPWRIYAVESVRAGLLPLWNPYAYCGTPFLANLQSAVLYPPNLLFLAAGARHGFGASAILHLALGGLFMYAFLCTLGLRREAGLVGALVLMFNGYTVTWLEFPTLSLWVFMWLPGILLCYERALRAPRSAWPALLAGAVGMQFLGGHFQISAYVAIAFLIYAAIRAFRSARGGPGGLRAVLLAAVPLMVGALLAAGQILPTLELARHAGRVSHGPAAALSAALPLHRLVLYLMPNFFGNPAHYNYWGNVEPYQALNFFETACYVGVLPLLLSAWAVRRWRESEFWFFAGLVVFALLAAVGSPVYLALYYLAPGFQELAGLGRVLCLAAFGLAGLAALGADGLLRRDRPAGAIWPIACAAILGAGAATALAYVRPLVTAREFLEAFPAFDRYLMWQALAFLGLLVAGALVLSLRARMWLGPGIFAALSVGLLLLDLLGFGIRFNPFVDPRMAYPDMGATRWLESNAGHWRVTSLVSGPDRVDWMAHNSAMIFGLRDIHGSDSLGVGRSLELVAGPDLDQANYPEPGSPLLGALGVRYLLTRRAVSDGWRLVYAGDAPIYQNERAVPRAYVVHRVRELDDLAARDALATDAGRLLEEALAPPGVAGALAPGPKQTRPPAPSRAWFDIDRPDALALRVEAAEGGMLVITDSYYPGWRARVDGEPAPIHRVNYAFRGVPVPRGAHTVQLTYEPASFRVGMFLSLVALAALVAAGSALHLLRRASTRATACRS